MTFCINQNIQIKSSLYKIEKILTWEIMSMIHPLLAVILMFSLVCRSLTNLIIGF